MKRLQRATMALCGLVLLISCRPQPVFQVTTEVSGLSKPWDVGWLPNGTMLVTERPGRLNVYVDGPTLPPVVYAPSDVVAEIEGGMLGLENPFQGGVLRPSRHRTRLHESKRNSGGWTVCTTAGALV